MNIHKARHPFVAVSFIKFSRFNYHTVCVCGPCNYHSIRSRRRAVKRDTRAPDTIVLLLLAGCWRHIVGWLGASVDMQFAVIEDDDWLDFGGYYSYDHDAMARREGRGNNKAAGWVAVCCTD